MQAQKERFRAQVEELKREVRNLRGRVEGMDGVVRSPTEGGNEGGEGRMGVTRRESLGTRMGPVRRESIKEHEMRIKNVERSFGI